MGRDLIIFWLMGSSTTTHSLWKTLWQQNFLNKSECLIILQKDSLEWLYHLNFFFCLAVQDCDWNLQNRFCLLMTSAAFYKCVPLKVKFMFLHIFKYVSASCLYQFTLYIIYYIFYGYNLHYILYYSVDF